MLNFLEYYNKLKITNRSFFSGRRSPLALEHMKSMVSRRPLDINIETTDYCPMQCVFCPNRKMKRTKQVMDMDLFLKICRDFHDLGGGAVGISSMQSDLFSDNLLLNRLAEIGNYKKSFFLYTTTNLVGASRLSDQDLEFFLKQFDFLEISLGGLTKEDYRLMFGIDAFDIVREQLFRVSGMVRHKKIRIKLDLCIRTNGINKLRKSELLSKLKENYTVSNVRNHFFTWGGLITQSDLPPGARIKVVDNKSRSKNCVVPWTTLAVNVDGSVVGCGCVDWEARHIIGNVRSQSISEVWNSLEAQDFRNAFMRGKIPELCRSCSHYCELDRSFSNPKLGNYTPLDGLYNRQ